jgi:hypothetical protein
MDVSFAPGNKQIDAINKITLSESVREQAFAIFAL